MNQIHARTSNYEALFEKDGAFIKLRGDAAARESARVEHFKDNDSGFLGWLQDNPDGFFINAERRPKSHYLVLHRASLPAH